jgi:hypothetical protein
MASVDGDGVDGPTINDKLRAMGQIPDDQDDMGDADVAALLFGAVPAGAAPIADGAAPRAPDAAAAPAPSDVASLASSTTGSKRRSPVWADFDEVRETVDGELRVIVVCIWMLDGTLPILCLNICCHIDLPLLCSSILNVAINC